MARPSAAPEPLRLPSCSLCCSWLPSARWDSSSTNTSGSGDTVSTGRYLPHATGRWLQFGAKLPTSEFPHPFEVRKEPSYRSRSPVAAGVFAQHCLRRPVAGLRLKLADFRQGFLSGPHVGYLHAFRVHGMLTRPAHVACAGFGRRGQQRQYVTMLPLATHRPQRVRPACTWCTPLVIRST